MAKIEWVITADRDRCVLAEIPAMKLVPSILTMAARAALAVLLPSSAAATTWAKPIPLERLIAWSDIIVVGVVRDTDTLVRQQPYQPRTIDVEQWIVPADSASKIVRVLGGNSHRARFGRRVLLLIAPGDPVLPTRSVIQVIDLQDARDVAWGLDELNSPWISQVTTSTSYHLVDLDSHPIEAPERDPLLVEIERILQAAKGSAAASSREGGHLRAVSLERRRAARAACSHVSRDERDHATQRILHGVEQHAG
jgi:hypothetical protein